MVAFRVAVRRENWCEESMPEFTELLRMPVAPPLSSHERNPPAAWPNEHDLPPKWWETDAEEST